MKRVGRVDIPQEAFLAVLKSRQHLRRIAPAIAVITFFLHFGGEAAAEKLHADPVAPATASARRTGPAGPRRPDHSLVPRVARRPRSDRTRSAGPHRGNEDPTDAALTRLDRHARPLTVRAYIGAAPRPGPRTTQAEYSDVGFAIAGIILARAAREPLAQAMRRRVFNVPGGAGLALQPDERPHAPLVHNYYYPRSLSDPVDLSDGSGLIPNRGYFADGSIGAVGLAGDVPSLARWGHALLGGGLLSPNSLRTMTRFHNTSPQLADTLELPAHHSYGLGLFRDSLDGHPMWGHPGGGIGGHSELWQLPHDRITIAVSWNDDALGRDAAPFLLSLLRTTLASH